MSIEAMRLALEALEEINELSIGENAICLPAEIDTAMGALRQAIEQAERPQTHSEECWRWHHQCAVARIERKAQPVAWMYVNADGECEQIEYETPPDDPSVTLLYTAPPQRKPLTDKEITEAIRKSSLYMKLSPHTPQPIWLAMLMGYARAIEAAHGIKGEE